MGIQFSLDKQIGAKAKHERLITQLNNLTQRIEHLSSKERFLADALYMRLYDYTTKNFDSDMEDNIRTLLDKYPMYAIQTASSYDSDVLKAFVYRLKENKSFSGHLSVKLNGWHVRLIYVKGEFYKAYTKNGRNITSQVIPCLETTNCLVLEDFENLDLVEIRGELVISKSNLELVQEYLDDAVSSYTGLSLICDSEDEKLWGLLNILAYNVITEGIMFSTKTEEYQYLEDLGFETPIYWVVEDLTKETFLDDLSSIVTDCEDEVRATDVQEGYNYLTDGLIFALDNSNYFKKMGKSLSKYQYGNINLRIGYWQQETYKGYIQTIYWQMEDDCLRPYAIVANRPNMIEFDDFGEYPYINNISSILNYERLGIITKEHKVVQVPLYNPSQILRLDAYVNTELTFVDDEVLGVLPCFDDGRVLLDGILQQVIQGEFTFDDSTEQTTNPTDR